MRGANCHSDAEALEPTLATEGGQAAERACRLSYLQGYDEAARRMYELQARDRLSVALAWEVCNNYRRQLHAWARGDPGRLQDPPQWPG